MGALEEGGATYPSKKVPDRETSPGCAGVLPIKIPEGQKLVSKSFPHSRICTRRSGYHSGTSHLGQQWGEGRGEHTQAIWQREGASIHKQWGGGRGEHTQAIGRREG